MTTSRSLQFDAARKAYLGYQCKLEFPLETKAGSYSVYSVEYQRRGLMHVHIVSNSFITGDHKLNYKRGPNDRMVVTYNPWLLLCFRSHINVQVSSTTNVIYYLFSVCPLRPPNPHHNATARDRLLDLIVCARLVYRVPDEGHRQEWWVGRHQHRGNQAQRAAARCEQ